MERPDPASGRLSKVPLPYVGRQGKRGARQAVRSLPDVTKEDEIDLKIPSCQLKVSMTVLRSNSLYSFKHSCPKAWLQRQPRSAERPQTGREAGQGCRLRPAGNKRQNLRTKSKIRPFLKMMYFHQCQLFKYMDY